MAITVLQQPPLYSPVYNDIVFTVDSTNKAQCNFRYICDIYVNGAFAKRLKLFPFGTNGYAEFKVARTLEDYVSYDLKENLYGFSSNSNSIIKYEIKFGEEYDSSTNCDAGTTLFTNLTNTSAFYAWNGVFQYREFESFDYDDFVVDDQFASFLTNMPSQVYIGVGQQFSINFLNTISNEVTEGTVKTYNGSGTLIKTVTITNSQATISASDVAKRIVSWGVGPDNLNNSVLATGTQPVIPNDSTVSYYEVYLSKSGTQKSEKKRFNIDRRITKWGVKRFWWLNRLGGFDSYSFTLVDEREIGITRTEYNKLIGNLRPGSPLYTWKYDLKDRGRTVIAVSAQERLKYRSNWLTEDEALWMEELFTSPEVYTIDTATVPCGEEIAENFDANLIPVVITSTVWEEKKKKNIKNIQYLIDLEPAHRVNLQRN